MKVHEALGWAEPVPGDVGIEIEVEAHDRLPSVPKDISSIWASKGDGSLRHIGREYVTEGAQPLDNSFKESLDTLCEAINKANIIKNSPRTSVHVHINVSNRSLTELWTGVCAFWLVENLLVDFCGEQRVSNLFCFRLKDTEGILKYVEKDLKASTPFSKHLAADQIRYAALNLNAIAKFGSVESRSMQGITDPVAIFDWAKLVHGVVHNPATQFADPSELLDYYYKTPRDELLNTLVGDAWSRKLIKHCGKQWDDMIEDNAERVIQVAYAHDWSKWESRIAAPAKRKPKAPIGLAGGDAQWIIPDNVVNMDNDALWQDQGAIMRVMEQQRRAARNPIINPIVNAADEDF
jgi:hypothetical protein